MPKEINIRFVYEETEEKFEPLSVEYGTGDSGIPISPVEHNSLIFRGSFNSYPGGTILYILSAKRAAFQSH